MSAVAKRKVFAIEEGGASAITESLRLDMTNASKADIRSMLLAIVGEETAAQTKLGNPPSITEVDGNRFKQPSQVNKKIVVLFGTSLAVATLREVESMLMRNIISSTESVTGSLADASNWEWRYIREGRQVPITGKNISFGARDFLVLRPKLGYASAVNKRVASGSRSLEYRASNSRKGKTAKRNQKLGFMAMTARQCRQIADLVPFSVTVGMTTAFKVPGELRKIGGTAYLLIAPRRKGYRR